MLKPIKIASDRSKTLKTNLIIWVVYSSAEFKAHMIAELSECLNVNIEWIELKLFVQENVKSKQSPDLVYVETGDGWAQKIAHVYSNDSNLQQSNTSLIVFGEEHDTASLKMALKLGASDYFSKKFDFEEIYPLLKTTAEEKIFSKKMGDLTLFINTKGGAGATTLALNSAIELASYVQSKVLLVDLDMQFSDAADYLNCKPKYSINDVVEQISDLDELSLDTLIFRHSSGLNYLCFNQENIKDNFKCAAGISKLLPLLRQFYSHIIVDMSHGIDHTFQQIISPATHVFLVVQQNVTSIKHASNYARILELDYSVGAHNIEVIVNRFDKKAEISVKDIESTIKGRSIHIVPNNFSLALECANLGNPIVQSKKNSAIKASLAEISHLLENPKEDEKSWFKKFFS